MMCKYFYRVTITLDDPGDDCSLAFDFKSIEEAGVFANTAYDSCDIVKVKIEIIENEVDTTNSPMWRLP